MKSIAIRFLLVCVLAVAAVRAVEDVTGEAGSDCVAWSDFSALDLTPGAWTTTRRRTANVPTLNCVGSCPARATLISAHCERVGFNDRGQPSWHCTPVFANRRRFGFASVRVECEGCNRRGDSKVVAGSCALFYSVKERGEATPAYRHQGDVVMVDPVSNLLGIFSVIFLVVFVIALTKRALCPEKPGGAFGPPAYAVAEGYPVGAGGAVHHYYHGGGGGGGFGTGTAFVGGMLVGDMLAHNRYHHDDGGYYRGGHRDDDHDDGGNWGGDAYGGGETS